MLEIKIKEDRIDTLLRNSNLIFILATLIKK